MNLTVRGDRIFVRPDMQPTQTESGLHIVYDRQQSTMTGTVVAVGDGPVTRKGVKLPHIVSVDERIVFSPDSGEELIFEREVLLSMKEEDVLAVID